MPILGGWMVNLPIRFTLNSNYDVLDHKILFRKGKKIALKFNYFTIHRGDHARIQKFFLRNEMNHCS